MNRTQLLRAAVVLAAVVFLWGVAEMLGGHSGEPAPSMALTPPIGADVLDTVTMSGPTDTIRLVRGTGGWTVNGYPADSAVLASFLTALRTPLSGELVARNAASHAQMGVDSLSGRVVRLRQGSQMLAELVVGHQGREYETAFVRRPGDDRVYLVTSPAAPMFQRTLTDWRDKRIVAIVPDSVARFEIVRGRASVTVSRHDPGWTFAGGAAADSGAVARLLNEYRSLVAQGSAFATPAQADSADFARPARRVTLFAANGRTLAALAFDSTAAGFWVRPANAETTYWLYRWKVDQITPTGDELRHH